MIRRDDEIVGYVRRADYAFALEKSIAYGYVSRPDKQVEIDVICSCTLATSVYTCKSCIVKLRITRAKFEFVDFDARALAACMASLTSIHRPAQLLAVYLEWWRHIDDK